MFDLQEHFDRLSQSVLELLTPEMVAEWIEKYTYLGGELYSFKDHEYQLRILQSTAPEIVVRKCSQVGISEMSFRRALGLADIIDGFSTIYTLPTATFAADVCKTRIDPIIADSPRLKAKIHKTLDNASIKQIGSSFIYIKGTFGNNQAISVPADLIVSDELDFSDEEVVSNFNSRLTHSDYKWQFYLSTPTAKNVGIDKKFKASRRHFNFVCCDHCGHFFQPDYYTHVKIPGYTGDLRDITANNIHKLDVDGATLLCPRCGMVPSLQVEHREWVCENTTERYAAEGFQVTPFDAPNIISIPYLIRASTKYKRRADFDNFNLGLPCEDAESSVLPSDVDQMYAMGLLGSNGQRVLGMDMGIYCACMIGEVGYDGQLHIIHTELIHYSQVDTRYEQLVREFRVTSAVIDSQPYVETVFRMQGRSPILWGSVYVTSKNLEPFRIQDKEEDEFAGLLAVRQVNVNRNIALEALFKAIRDKEISIRADSNKEIIGIQLCDMRRIKDTSARDVTDESFIWKKSAEGNDHFHHALLYTWVAAKLRSVPTHSQALPLLISSFKQKSTI